MNKKVTRTILIIYIITIVVTVAGISYAYFTDILVSNVSPEVDVTSATTEFIVFNVGKEINLVANEDNMALGLNSISDETIASASLKLGDNQSSVTHKYNIYLEIEENDFEYTTLDKRAELLVSVNGPNGLVTNTDGLEFREVKDNVGNLVKGFDVTTKKGKYYLVKDFPITADSAKTVVHNWGVKMTFVNLKDLQNGNSEKTLKGHIEIEKAD